jgi:hypothetical protein
MDIDLLSKMVKELILDNDKVVLPGLGAFVAEMVPAAFSDKGYTINPPYRRLYFRSKPDEGELLAKFYASSNEVDFNVADKAIKDFISELKSILYVKKMIVFPGLGRMRATKENAVFFIADEDLDIYPEGLGLEPISLKTHQETREEVEAAIVGLKALVEEPVVEQKAAEPELQENVEPIDTEPMPEPIPESMPEPVIEPTPEPSPAPAQTPEPVLPVSQSAVPVPSRNYAKIIMWVLVAAVVLLAVFVVVARLNPGLMDNLLYTPEQLEILNQ